MAAQEACVGPGRLAEGVLRAAGGALDLRLGGAALLPGFDLEGQGNALRQAENGEAVEQAADGVDGVRTPLGHGAADRAVDDPIRQLLRLRFAQAGQGTEDGLGHVPAGGQAVQKIEHAVLAADAQRPAAEVRHAGKGFVDLCRTERF